MIEREHREDPAYCEEHRRLVLPREIAWQVVKRRGELGWSQQELARRMGTSHSAISRIERGQHLISLRTLERLVEALGVRASIEFEAEPDLG